MTNEPTPIGPPEPPSRLLASLRSWPGGALIGLVLALVFFAGRGTLDEATGERMHMLVSVLAVALRTGLVAALWWLAAIGFGFGILRLVRAARREPERATTSRDDLAIAIASGAAALLFLDATLASLGLFSRLGSIAAWVPIAAGGFLAVRTLRDRGVAADRDAAPAPWYAGAGIGAIVALMAVAAASSPGWLWSSEFGGYDALSYHLELPKHWLLRGVAAGPVEGNVYSALPSFVECAFLHLMGMRGDIYDGAFACQWWSALATLATAFVVARLGRATGLAVDGAAAAILFLAIPWAIVVGTLAYNDMVPLLMLAGGWLMLASLRTRGEQLHASDAAVLALIAAAAVGAKPTALLFTAIPLLALTVHLHGLAALRLAPIVVTVAVGALAPWLVRNGLAYGNPFFPFLAGLFGDGPWTAAQHENFRAAHGASGTLVERATLLSKEWLAHGIGEPPRAGEPWFPQWGVAPIAGLVGLAVAARRSRHAAAALVALAVMVAGWLLFTHLKSRFLMPTAVPLVLGCGVLAGLVARASSRGVALVLALCMLALPVAAFLREPVKGNQAFGQPAALVDAMADMTGHSLRRAIEEAKPEEREALLRRSSTPFAINHAMPPGARTIAIGFATPFYLFGDVASTTVWDRGPFERAIDASPADPSAWGPRLRSEGFTHALLDPNMLVRWRESGWLDASLGDLSWIEPFVRANRPFAATIDGRLIVELTSP